MSITPKIRPCLWFDNQAEDAARYYTGIFKNSRIVHTSHYGEAGKEIHRRPPGSVMVPFVGRRQGELRRPAGNALRRRFRIGSSLGRQAAGRL